MKNFKKVVTAIIVASVILATLSISAFAGSASSVTYDGNAQKFIFAKGSEYSPTDLFEAFKDVMPGDKLTQPITVNNDISEKIKIKVYMRATGAEEGSEALLSQMNLTVKQNGTSELFAAPADETAGLTDWVCLGTIYSGGKIDLDVTLDVPITLDNNFQNSIGKLEWQFKVEELPVDPGDPSPKTGDTNNYFLFGAIMLIAIIGVACVVIVAKKRTNESK